MSEWFLTKEKLITRLRSLWRYHLCYRSEGVFREFLKEKTGFRDINQVDIQALAILCIEMQSFVDDKKRRLGWSSQSSDPVIQQLEREKNGKAFKSEKNEAVR